MTLIIGIRCHDGVVVGADGAITLGDAGVITAQQAEYQKVDVLDGRAIFAAAGDVGLGQQMLAEARSWLAADRAATAVDDVRRLSTKLWNNVQSAAFSRLSLIRQATASTATDGAFQATALLAHVADRAHTLTYFNVGCQPTEATASHPWFAIGSGQAIADPFLAFVRRIMWRRGLPSVADAAFAITWTLHQAVQTNVGGIGLPLSVAQLTTGDGVSRARLLERDEVAAHEEAVRDIEAKFGDWRDFIGRTGAVGAELTPPA